MRNMQWKKLKKSREPPFFTQTPLILNLCAFTRPERNWTLLMGACAEQTPGGNKIIIIGPPSL